LDQRDEGFSTERKVKMTPNEIPTQIAEPLLKGLADIINLVLAFIITTLLPYLFLLFRNWYKLKIAEMRTRISAIENADLRNGINDALTRLDQTTETVVAEIEATIKKIDARTAKVVNAEEIKVVARNRILARLPPNVQRVLCSTYEPKDLDRLVDSKIERKALAMKLAKKRSLKQPDCSQSRAI
jgi:hypothetical protein